MIRVLIVGEYGDRPEAALLKGLKEQGFAVTPVYRPGNLMFRSLEEAGLDPIPLAPRSKLDMRAVRCVREILSGGKFDIMHAFTSRMLCVGLLASRGQDGLRRVWHRGTVYYPKRRRFLDRVTFFNPDLHCVIGIAHAVSDALVKAGVPSGKVHTIYKGHSPEWYREGAADIRGEWGIPAERFIVGTVANVRPVKGIEFLARAVSQLCGEGTDAHLVVVGRDPKLRLSSLVRSLGIADRVTFCGYRDDILRIVPGFDCFVMPSLAGEGLCKAVIEAIHMGVPVIASSAGGLPELVRDGVTGLLVSPGDAGVIAEGIRRLAGDSCLAARLTSSARDLVAREMSVENMVKRTSALYEELADSG